MDEKETQLGEAEKQLRKTRQDLKESKEKAKKWAEKEKKNREKCKETEKRLQTLTGLEEEAEEIAGKIEEFEDIDSAIKSWKAELEKTREEVQELKELRKDLKSEAESQDLDMVKALEIVRDVSDLRGEKQELENEISGLNDRIAKKGKRSRQLNGRIGSLEKKKKKLEKEINVRDGRLNAVNTTIWKQQQQLEYTSQQLSNLRQQFKQNVNSVAAAQDAKRELEAELRELKDEKDRIQGEVTAAQRSKNEASRKEEKAKERVGEIITRATKVLNNLIEEKKEELNSIEREKGEELDSVEEDIKRGEGEREELRIRLMALGAKIGRLKREAKLAEWDKGVLFDIEEKDDEWLREALKELGAEKNRRKKTGDFEGGEPGETGEVAIAVPAGYENKKQAVGAEKGEKEA
ncbi:hypothetical protein AKJ61_02120 [candidate division MSBL1 archaeon SCGC-AAA259B11]|uniref:Uncharacterized protein n=1 Tax=candidate division MSBL1 archaeon SCGC-AAA259B11 TaxID=1698260 RepID=A0A133U6L4_9EURY|nr:hypothetical protein AKJ61_02120 [candidate division MSBL1 archaeon SCGC-AAA259B11]